MLRTLALLALTLLAAACDHSSFPRAGAGSAQLRGEWLAVHPAPQGARTEERLTFGEDGSFASSTEWYGHHGQPSGKLTGYHRTAGQYEVEGSRLRVRIARTEGWQMYAVGPNPTQATLANPQWGDYGTIRVAGDRLSRTFVSAPADAPQEFTEVFQRVR